MHCELEEFLLVLSFVPAFFLHHLAEVRQSVRIVVLRILSMELVAVLLCKFYDLRCQRARKVAHLALDHSPGILVYVAEALLALAHCKDVHKCGVLGILAERSNERWITELWPYILNLLEEFHEELVNCALVLSVSALCSVDGTLEHFQVRHH